MKKAVILDNEWVMVKNDWDSVAEAVADEFGLPVMDGMDFKQFLQGSDYRLREWSAGRRTYEGFWGSVLDDYGIENTPGNRQKLSSKLEELTTEVNDELVDLVKDLKKGGLEVYMLSNATPEITAGNKRRDDYHNDFDGEYFSFLMHTRKPEEAAYLRVANDNHLDPSECVFIDDKDKNVEAAEYAGMTGIKYKIGDSVDTLKERLKAEGIEIESQQDQK